MNKEYLREVLFFKNNRFIYISIIVSLVIFLVLSFVISFKDVINLDIIVRDFAYQIRGEKYGVCYWIFRLLTELGFVFVLLFLYICFCISVRFDIRSLVLGAGVLVTYLINSLVKLIFSRERPLEDNRWMEESSSSFPSGHSMTSMFFYTLIAYFLLHSLRLGKKTKLILSSLCIFSIIVVGISRIILGVHYFTDVIGGYALGFMLAMIAILVFKSLEAKGYKFLSRFFIKNPKLK